MWRELGSGVETDASGVIWEIPRNESDGRVTMVNRTVQHLTSTEGRQMLTVPASRRWRAGQSATSLKLRDL